MPFPTITKKHWINQNTNRCVTQKLWAFITTNPRDVPSLCMKYFMYTWNLKNKKPSSLGFIFGIGMGFFVWILYNQYCRELLLCMTERGWSMLIWCVMKRNWVYTISPLNFDEFLYNLFFIKFITENWWFFFLSPALCRFNAKIILLLS
jgi:hypothetical protein